MMTLRPGRSNLAVPIGQMIEAEMPSSQRSHYLAQLIPIMVD